jgi:lipoprotein signal peptidase
MNQTRVAIPLPGTARCDAAGKSRPRQDLVALGLLTAVVLLDQTTKWWGWRHAAEAIINPGGTWTTGRTVSGWYSGPVTGALLDVLGFVLLSLAAFSLVRRGRPGLVLVSGALMIAGWSSNLLDRLGMHTVTAPGSVRGAIDFIRLGPYYYNVADVVIVGATAVFLLAVCAMGWRTSHHAAASRYVTPPAHRRPGVPRPAWTSAASAPHLVRAGEP